MKSLDLQMLLPKSTEVAKSRQVEQQRPETAQQQFALETRRQVIMQQRTVRHAGEARGGRVDRNGRRGSGGPGGRNQSRPRSDEACAQRATTAARGGVGDPDLRPESDIKGKLIDIVLDSMSNWGNS